MAKKPPTRPLLLRSVQALRASVDQPAQCSPKARRKALSKRTEAGLPVHAFQTLLKALATLTKNTVAAALNLEATLDLLDVKPKM